MVDDPVIAILRNIAADILALRQKLVDEPREYEAARAKVMLECNKAFLETRTQMEKKND